MDMYSVEYNIYGNFIKINFSKIYYYQTKMYFLALLRHRASTKRKTTNYAKILQTTFRLNGNAILTTNGNLNKCADSLSERKPNYMIIKDEKFLQEEEIIKF